MFDAFIRLSRRLFGPKTRGLEIERRLEPVEFLPPAPAPRVSALAHARILAIQSRTLESQKEAERRLRRLREESYERPNFLPVYIPGPSFDYPVRAVESMPATEQFIGGGGESGGAGASGTFDIPSELGGGGPSCESSPSCDPSPSNE